MEPEQQDHSLADSHAGETSLGNATRRLRTTLQRIFQDARLQSADKPVSEHLHLRPALAQVCKDARHAGLRAEQLLVLIKDVWAGIPAGLSRVQSLHGDERLNYVISVCVDEYYDDGEESP